jgi:hypothetical protein
MTAAAVVRSERSPSSRYVTRAEWDTAERMRREQLGAAYARESDRMELLREIRADQKEILKWMNEQKAAEKEIQKTIEQFTAFKNWLSGVKTWSLRIGGIITMLLIALATLAKVFIFDPIWRHVMPGK